MSLINIQTSVISSLHHHKNGHEALIQLHATLSMSTRRALSGAVHSQTDSSYTTFHASLQRHAVNDLITSGDAWNHSLRQVMIASRRLPGFSFCASCKAVIPFESVASLRAPHNNNILIALLSSCLTAVCNTCFVLPLIVVFGVCTSS
mmetsp:Transcript_115716/g.180808  ORF Transcript_115716/g.180808 Transcript_115716/m.180808 type:complete len:148 (-) Transcript_115716:518-961(-)